MSGGITTTGINNPELNTANWLDGNTQALQTARADASFTIFQRQDGIYLNYSAVPEPGAAHIGGSGMLVLLRRRRVG